MQLQPANERDRYVCWGLAYLHHHFGWLEEATSKLSAWLVNNVYNLNEREGGRVLAKRAAELSSSMLVFFMLSPCLPAC
uniref:Uncharacterized protein n=1 Tax=Kalanchoe fedtschenkoi TaxID=63787 RepID=A0A7N0V395_KALFE